MTKALDGCSILWSSPGSYTHACAHTHPHTPDHMHDHAHTLHTHKILDLSSCDSSGLFCVSATIYLHSCVVTCVSLVICGSEGILQVILLKNTLSGSWVTQVAESRIQQEPESCWTQSLGAFLERGHQVPSGMPSLPPSVWSDLLGPPAPLSVPICPLLHPHSTVQPQPFLRNHLKIASPCSVAPPCPKDGGKYTDLPQVLHPVACPLLPPATAFHLC